MENNRVPKSLSHCKKTKLITENHLKSFWRKNQGGKKKTDDCPCDKSQDTINEMENKKPAIPPIKKPAPSIINVETVSCLARLKGKMTKNPNNPPMKNPADLTPPMKRRYPQKQAIKPPIIKTINRIGIPIDKRVNLCS